VAAPVTLRTRQVLVGLALVGALAVIAVMAVTGGRRELQSFVAFRAAGVMADDPRSVTRVELADGGRTRALARGADGAWQNEGGRRLDPGSARRLDTALGFLRDSKPIRVLGRGDYDPARLAEFGLAPPRYRVALFAGPRAALSLEFGGINPSQSAQYVRLPGSGRITLLPTFVGQEWEAVRGLASTPSPEGAVTR
jgi:hypothetical protein